MLGHEITALTGIDHARTLAVVQPANWRIKKEKRERNYFNMLRGSGGLQRGVRMPG
jgi:NADP-dependent alcohol dehydrogenase